jgi:hypothetical protein
MLHMEYRFALLDARFNGLVTKDKFCLTRTITYPLSWWRRPLRLRS